MPKKYTGINFADADKILRKSCFPHKQAQQPLPGYSAVMRVLDTLLLVLNNTTGPTLDAFDAALDAWARTSGHWDPENKPLLVSTTATLSCMSCDLREQIIQDEQYRDPLRVACKAIRDSYENDLPEQMRPALVQVFSTIPGDQRIRNFKSYDHRTGFFRETVGQTECLTGTINGQTLTLQHPSATTNPLANVTWPEESVKFVAPFNRKIEVCNFVFSKLARLFDWRNALVIVQPATLIAWHRAAFCRFWRWKRNPSGDRP